MRKVTRRGRRNVHQHPSHIPQIIQRRRAICHVIRRISGYFRVGYVDHPCLVCVKSLCGEVCGWCEASEVATVTAGDYQNVGRRSDSNDEDGSPFEVDQSRRRRSRRRRSTTFDRIKGESPFIYIPLLQVAAISQDEQASLVLFGSDRRTPRSRGNAGDSTSLFGD